MSVLAEVDQDRAVLVQASAVLRKAMKEHHPPLTPVTLGEKMGVTRQAVLRMLAGQNVQLATYAKYLDACGQRIEISSKPS